MKSFTKHYIDYVNNHYVLFIITKVWRKKKYSCDSNRNARFDKSSVKLFRSALTRLTMTIANIRTGSAHSEEEEEDIKLWFANRLKIWVEDVGWRTIYKTQYYDTNRKFIYFKKAKTIIVLGKNSSQIRYWKKFHKNPTSLNLET